MKASAIALLILAAACGDSTGSDPDAAAGAADANLNAPDADPSAPDAGPDQPIFGSSAGNITLTESRFSTNNNTYADIRVAFEPSRTTFHREDMRAGSCRLLRYEATFCNPQCNFDQLCSESGCVSFPTFQSAGTVTVSGLRQATTISWNGGYYYQDQSLPGDFFEDSATITASAPGADFPAFSVTAGGVQQVSATLSGSMNDELRLVDGSDLTLTWSGSEPGARVRLTLLSPNDAHGLPSNHIIECDAPDTGSLTIPRALVEAFPAQQRLEICVAHDCPPSHLLRYRRGTASTASGEVELLVGSKQLFFLVHEVN